MAVASTRQSRQEQLGRSQLELQTRPESGRPTRYDLAPLRPCWLVAGQAEVRSQLTDSDCSA